MTYTAERVRDAIVVRSDDVKAGWEQWFLLRSDAHHDAPTCDRALEKEHLDEAIDRDAGILDFGDLHDAMQGRNDRRRSREGMRQELAQTTYLNAVVTEAADFYEPYAQHWILFADGNHETAVARHSDYSLTSGLVQLLSERTGAVPFAGGYEGWVRFAFKIHKTQCQSFLLYYTHGSGGGSPVTRGTINTNRRSVYLPDADFVVSGHTHNAFNLPIPRQRISNLNVVYYDECEHIQIPTYKRRDEWEIETEKNPKPLGAYWLRFFYRRNGIESQVIRAK